MAQFVKVAILECLRQRIFLTTETWSTWLRRAVDLHGVDLDYEEVRSVTDLLESRQLSLRLETSMEQLVRTMEYVMTSLEIENNWRDEPELQHELLDLRHQCECGRAFAKSLRDIRQEDGELRQSAVEIKSAEDSARLTLLAAIFLPLSLSTSLLAMTTRLKDLHVLLYDFVGVAIVLSCLAVVFYWIVRSVRKVSRAVKERHLIGFTKHPYLVAVARYYDSQVYSFCYIIIAVTFLIGMLHDITAGWATLAYIIAVLAALILSSTLIVIADNFLTKLPWVIRLRRSLLAALQPAP